GGAGGRSHERVTSKAGSTARASAIVSLRPSARRTQESSSLFQCTVWRPSLSMSSQVGQRSPCTNSAPNSRGKPAKALSVWTRPPRRSRASRTTTSRSVSTSACAAARPATPAPRTTTSAVSVTCMRHRSSGRLSSSEVARVRSGVPGPTGAPHRDGRRHLGLAQARTRGARTPRRLLQARLVDQEDGGVTGLPLRVVVLDDRARLEPAPQLHRHRRVDDLAGDHALAVLARRHQFAVAVVAHEHPARVPALEVQLVDQLEPGAVERRPDAVTLVVGVDG